jgi:adenylate cyclase
MAGPDIFLSYNREDAERAKTFAEGFAAQGLDVWWDQHLRSGEAYDRVTEEALRGAKAVVVLWSKRSVDSHWVRAEATLAQRNKTLMPAMIEPCERPIMFELTQTADLSHWQGDTSDRAWLAFIEDVRKFTGRSPPAMVVARPPVTAASPAQTSVVVLPFANMGGDPEQEYFADGISEDIITDLSKVSSLLVISRNSAFTYKGRHVDIPSVARELGVTHVLEGSVRKAGNRVRVTAQLIDGTTNGHVWAERFDRDLDDIFALQDELSQEIVKALRVRLLPQEKKAIEARPTTSTEAYDLYMRARAAASAANSAEEILAAFEMFKQVLEIDPFFAPALGGLAMEALQVVNIADERREAVLADLIACYEKVSGDEPESWAAQLLLATRKAAEGNPTGSFEAFEKAMAVAPSFDTDVACNFAQQLGFVGRVNDALQLLEAARRIDPLSAPVSATLQIIGLCGERFDESHAEFDRFREAGGDREEMEHNALFRVWLEGDLDATRAQYRRFLDARAIPIPELDRCYDLFGQHEAALAILRQGLDAPENQQGIKQFLLAFHAALHGDPELALQGMRRAALDYRNVASYMLWYPFLKDARQLPGYKQLMRDLGIYDYWRKSGNWGDFARPVGDDDFEIVG